MGAQFSSAADFVLCLLQLELGGWWEPGGRLLLRHLPGLRDSWWSRPPTEVLHHWERGWRGVGQSLGVFATDGAQWVFCILKFTKRQGSKKSCSVLLRHSVPGAKDGVCVTVVPMRNSGAVGSCVCALPGAWPGHGAGVGAFATSISVCLR